MIKNFILIFLGISFIYPQCQDNEVEIWSTCYSIENTIALHNSENTFGEIPVTVCDLVNLEILDLEVMWGNTNYVTGILPECIGQLTNLTYLNLGWNQLYGHLPESIGNLSNLTFMNLLSNQFSGEIPNEIGSLINLNYLNFGLNNFSGPIPDSIGNLTQ